MDGVIQASAKKNIQWQEELYFAVKFAQQMLTQYYAEVTPITGVHLISAHIFDLFQTLRSFNK